MKKVLIESDYVYYKFYSGSYDEALQYLNRKSRKLPFDDPVYFIKTRSDNHVLFICSRRKSCNIDALYTKLLSKSD